MSKTLKQAKADHRADLADTKAPKGALNVNSNNLLARFSGLSKKLDKFGENYKGLKINNLVATNMGGNGKRLVLSGEI